MLEYSLHSEGETDSLYLYYKEGGMMLCELLWILEETWQDPNTMMHHLGVNDKTPSSGWRLGPLKLNSGDKAQKATLLSP